MKKILISLIIIVLFLLIIVNSVSARTPQKVPEVEKLQLQIPLLNYSESTGIAEYIGYAYQAALYIIVPLAIIVVIYSGFMWIMAGGDRSKIQNAKKYISGSFWGLTLALLSYVILSLVGIGELNEPTPEYITFPNEEYDALYKDILCPPHKGAHPSYVNQIRNNAYSFNLQNKDEIILASFIDEVEKVTCFPVNKNDISRISWNFGNTRKKALRTASEIEAAEKCGWDIITDANGKKKGPEGSRCHVGTDIITKGDGRVIAIAPGKVVSILKNFYKCSGGWVGSIMIYHKPFTINYAEINTTDLNSSELKVGDNVFAGQLLGSATNCGMLHLEMYSGQVTTNARWYPSGCNIAEYKPNSCQIDYSDTMPASLIDATDTLTELNEKYLCPADEPTQIQ